MTPKPIDSLTEQELRVECAESDGWIWIEEDKPTYWRGLWKRGKEVLIPRGDDPTTNRRNRADILPNYPASRDAVIEAILRKDERFQREFDDQLLLRADWAEPRTLLPAIDWARAFAATARKLKV